MSIRDILSPERIRCDVPATSKKSALETLSEVLASSDPALTPGTVFDCLIARERLGSTGLGDGVAIPHGRLPQVERAIGAFLKLSQAVDFDALDKQPVDLLFGLVVPTDCTDEHLQILAHLAELVGDRSVRAALRSHVPNSEIFELFGGQSQKN